FMRFRLRERRGEARLRLRETLRVDHDALAGGVPVTAELRLHLLPGGVELLARTPVRRRRRPQRRHERTDARIDRGGDALAIAGRDATAVRFRLREAAREFRSGFRE